jgi:ubiquinone/menaquinone biosynthesis C-methylase UbiE
MGWQEEEAKRYDEAYATGQYVPTFGPWFFGTMVKAFNLSRIKTMLDVGCGTGITVKLARHIGIKAFGIDFAKSASEQWKKNGVGNYCQVASADAIPYGDDEFDLVLCTEMLEHIPEKGVPKVLREMYRVGRGDYVFTVALGVANIKMPTDGSEPHVCVKPAWWWEQQAVHAGYNTIAENVHEKVGSMIIWSSKHAD